ncbi:tRNA (guanosine(37)-N1)-methyltransferase TrmD [Pontivivens insulae]|uniref:tRNA (guanine-N(1)-)-methyltransferase n=1 Tax=Pontivivens insulae TaxID=1639689 RepID=A0A2R8ADT8_9RHOB|nr:tRNA (guanosine(37)-N1)-methyltransferase TrmD [Pontivivens insulae]RED14340.1 tRNA (guanine37-N(1)-) methyltransferase [Pontivivens insulae]SPF30417.1 tRNA (guanine-N(1)-)-methyltransferase [Pontivivens insulae]
MAIRSHGRKSIAVSAKPRDLMGESELIGVWTARILTLYPDMFPGILGHSLTGRALREGKWQLDTTNIRDFGLGKHRAVDDTPTGGGAGMVLRADVLDEAIRARPVTGPLIYLSPRGRRFDQAMARHFAAGPGVTLLCGRFEGVDQRVLDAHNIFEVSLGDFVLTGGEIAAQAIIDATVRLLPGVLGNAASTEEESHSAGLLEHPQYTQPRAWQGRSVPDVLLSGNHGEIEKWRRAQAEALTQERRPDMWAAHQAAQSDKT